MSIAGGYWRAVERGAAVGCDCVQLFTNNNNQWRAKPIAAAKPLRPTYIIVTSCSEKHPKGGLLPLANLGPNANEYRHFWKFWLEWGYLFKLSIHTSPPEIVSGKFTHDERSIVLLLNAGRERFEGEFFADKPGARRKTWPHTT
jgi:hypothetical protein